MHGKRRALETFVIVAASLVLPGAAAAGEIHGRLLVGDRPGAGITLSALPHESKEAEARRLARREAAPRPLAQATTRADGTFTIVLPAAPAATFRLLAEGGGAVPSWVGGTYETSETDDLGEHALARAEMLGGRVTSATGAAVAGAQVTIRPRGPSASGDPEVTPAARTVVTGADGGFRSTEAAADGNRITVMAPSYGAAMVASARAGTLPRPITLTLGALVSGRVVRADGKTPAPGALVRFEGDGLETAWIEAGRDGRFQLADLPRRPGTVVAEGGDVGLGEASTGPLPLPPGRVVTVVLAPPPTLEGRVLDTRTRAPVPRVRLTVEDGARTTATRSGPDGRYVFRGLLPQRRYRLRADEPRYSPYVRERVLLATSETVRIDVPLTLAATLAGRVVDEAGKPIGGALGRIVATADGGGIASRLRAVRAADRLVFRSAPDGSFKATRLAAGEDQRLTVVHPDFEPRTTGGLSLPPGTTKTLNVVLRRGLSLAGRVRDEAGRPVAGASVELVSRRDFRSRAAAFLSGAGLASGRPQATTGPDGRFLVKGVAEGAYALTASKEGYADQRLEGLSIDAGPRDPIEITLAAGAAIRGTVLRRDGRAAEGYWVRATAPGDSPGPGLGPFGPQGARATGADGSFSITGLRAGETYDLVLRGPDGAPARRESVDAPAEDVEVVVAGPGRIAGRVVDAQSSAPVRDFQVDFGPDRSSGRGGFGRGGGRPMGRAVRAAADGGGAQPVHSDDGTFVLDEVPAGTWEVVAQAKGYQSARVGSITVEEGGAHEGVEVRLTPGNAIRGRVLDGASGAPVLDASVTLQRAGGGGRALGLLMGDTDARSDGDGRFVIEGLAAGSYSLVAQHPDYADATALVELKEGPASAELRMMPGGTLGGLVVSEMRSPLAGAMVTLSSGGAGGGGGFGRGALLGLLGAETTITDDAGRFRFRHVSAGRYSAAASLGGRRTLPVDVVLQSGESRDDVVLALAAGTRIRGVVSGAPAALRDSIGVAASGPGGYSASTRASADGAFELTGAPAGAVNLRATAGDSAGNMRSAMAQVAIAEGQEEAAVQIVFEPGYTLSGTVTRSGQPVEGAMVLAGAGGRSASARTDAAGAFRVEGLSEGRYTVSVMAPGSARGPQSRSIEVSGDMTLDLVIPSARIAGVVLDAGTRQPLPDATVQGSGSQGGRPPGMSVTDSNGRFSLEDLDPSPCTVTVRKTGYQLQTRAVTPAEGAEEDVVFELARGTGIGVEVRDAAFGVPLRAVQVRATDGGGASAFAGTVPLDTEGRGEVPSLAPGSYGLAVYAAGYAPALLVAAAPAARLVVPMAPGGAVEIRSGPVTLARGPARVQVLTAGGQPYPFAFFSGDGRLTLTAPIRRVDNLGPGAYVLQVQGGEARPFEIQAGGVTTIALP